MNKNVDDAWRDGEDEMNSPIAMMAVFGGLVIVAGIICMLVWGISHSKKNNDAVAGNPVPAPSSNPIVETLADETSKTDENSWTDMEPVSGIEDMAFRDISEEVTARDVINLRNTPDASSEENVVGQLNNGEVATRIGYNSEYGWSKLKYDGQEVYAATKYLTSDLSHRPIVVNTDKNRVTTEEGKVVIFQDCNDTVTPKEYVNLRTEPSTAQGKATVRCVMNKGEQAHRTGYSPDAGWSRLEYNDEVLYVVTSYLEKAE